MRGRASAAGWGSGSKPRSIHHRHYRGFWLSRAIQWYTEITTQANIAIATHSWINTNKLYKYKWFSLPVSICSPSGRWEEYHQEYLSWSQLKPFALKFFSCPVSALHVRLSHIYTPPPSPCCLASSERHCSLSVSGTRWLTAAAALSKTKVTFQLPWCWDKLSFLYDTFFPEIIVFCPSPISSPPLQGCAGQSYPCVPEFTWFSSFHYILCRNKLKVVINQSDTGI